MSEITTLITWVHPRTRSTALQRCWLQHPEVNTLHEPLTQAFLYGPERVSSRCDNPKEWGKEQERYKDWTYEKCWKDITTVEGSPRKRINVVKEMAKVLFPIESPMASMPKLPFLTKDGNPTFIPTNKLLDPKIKHAFLIRDPNDAFPSLIKPLLHKRSEGFFNKEELGVTHIRQLYDFISEKTDNKPLVIDSDDLVDNTEAALRALCEYADLPFDTNMLSWESGASDARTLFECFEGGADLWHSDALYSTGFTGTRSRSEADTTSLEYAAELRKAIDDFMPDYLELAKHALHLPTSGTA